MYITVQTCNDIHYTGNIIPYIVAKGTDLNSVLDETIPKMMDFAEMLETDFHEIGDEWCVEYGTVRETCKYSLKKSGDFVCYVARINGQNSMETSYDMAYTIYRL